MNNEKDTLLYSVYSVYASEPVLSQHKLDSYNLWELRAHHGSAGRALESVLELGDSICDFLIVGQQPEINMFINRWPTIID